MERKERKGRREEREGIGGKAAPKFFWEMVGFTEACAYNL